MRNCLKLTLLSLGLAIGGDVWCAGPDADLIAKGAYLAKAADCTACHTAPGGRAFAGGLPMNTPAGTVYATNITPDKSTGIGGYTEEEFSRAVRKGVSKEHNLYPAMPYPSYAKLHDDDVHALYVYFMNAVAPVAQPNKASTIPAVLNWRWPLKIWNLLFLKNTVYQDKSGKDAVWNRGAYLVQSAGHCGACHTPRGIFFQEKGLDESQKAYLSGAALDGWYASNLTGDGNTGLGRWRDTELASFLKTGANLHATAFGSMTDVINNSTQNLSDADAQAISTYIKSLAPTDGNSRPAYVYDPKPTLALLMSPNNDRGAQLYGVYCVGCHAANGQAAPPYVAPLAGNPNLLQEDPSSLINVVLNGTHELVIAGVPAPYPMPRFGTVLSDADIAELVSFMRAGWNNGGAVVPQKAVTKLRKQTRPAG
jgi:mono/diheme cytochrome c family protein